MNDSQSSQTEALSYAGLDSLTFLLNDLLITPCQQAYAGHTSLSTPHLTFTIYGASLHALPCIFFLLIKDAPDALNAPSRYSVFSVQLRLSNSFLFLSHLAESDAGFKAGNQTCELAFGLHALSSCNIATRK